MSTELARQNGTNKLSPAHQMQQAQDSLHVQEVALGNLAREVKAAKSDIGTHPARYAALCAAYDKQYEQVVRSQETVRRLQETQAFEAALDADHWAHRAEELTAALTEEYAGRGPQYEILIRRLVRAEVLAEQLEGTGRALHTGEWRAANRAVLDATQALQKYTESQKSEVVQRERQQAMIVIMEVAERVIAPRYPELWANVVDEIDHLMLKSGHEED